MKTISTVNIENYRKLVQFYINMHSYNAALFWADKVVALTGNAKDIYWLAQCMFLLRQYHRAAHLLQARNLDKTHVLCNYLTVRCLFEANEFNEALKLINEMDVTKLQQKPTTPSTSMNEVVFFEDFPVNQIIASILLLKGKILEAMDNRGLAADCYRQALHFDVYCFEAFDYLIKYQMLSALEEQELLDSLPITEQCSIEETEILKTLYESRLKKYHTLTERKPAESKILFGSCEEMDIMKVPSTPNLMSSLPVTPVAIVVTPCSMSTPNVARNNDKNLKKTRSQSNQLMQQQQQTQSLDSTENPLLLRLKDSLDLHVAEAERLYYNCDYHKCSSLTESILKQDPYHSGCLPIHISCQVELKQSNKLFSLAHNLVDLYPNMAISWFAVGCYYYIIGKSDFARRFLAKATCLDRLFGPAWLAYGHSFAVENEHDQAMAAYFKASQLMKGCHLPLLYIGLECGLTNNIRLAEKFFQQAQNIAPEDPFIMHEKGVIAFQNLEYEDAEGHFRKALDRIKRIKNGLLSPSWEPLLNNLGHTCRKLKKFEEALDFHSQALLLSPQSSSTYSAIAYVHVLMGHTDEAVNWFHRALGLKRDDTFSTTMLNYVIEQLSDEKPPYPGAPEGIPNFQIENRTRSTIEEDSQNMNNEISDMSMSIEVDD